ncbi:kinase-like domain-containing protein [Jimgerdemannia flammicorona]|uniref:Kinase-like domain-containing protein n=1 Tax=Jimgerdemannia flammicorona TaxID=994334 RepID=A0A433QH46_9FUNG|nr:kinase-like domain-containing protein [Jimgerdemannia flammicorona]
MHTNTNTQNVINITPTIEVDPNDNLTSYDGVRRLSPEDVQQGQPIGSGGCGQIYKAILDNTITVAIKKVKEIGENNKKTPAEIQTALLKEVKILARLRECKWSSRSSVTTTPIRIQCFRLSWNMPRMGISGIMLARICAEIAKALHEVHKLRVIHGDMKASNVLIDSGVTAKLVDFGVSKTYTSIAKGSYPGQTLRWTAPERFDNEKKNMTHEQMVLADVYGYGMLVWEVVTDGKRPYDGYTEDTVYRKKMGAAISKPSEDLNPLKDVGDTPEDAPEVFRELIQQCLAVEPSRRPSLVSIKSSLDNYLATAAPSSTVARSSDTAATEWLAPISPSQQILLDASPEMSPPSILSTSSPREDKCNEWLQIIAGDMPALDALDLETLGKEQRDAVENGMEYFRRKKFDQAIKFFQNLDVDNPLYLRVVGLCYIAMDNKEKAFQHLKATARRDDGKGQYYVAWCYDHGYGVLPSKVEAFNWYSRSAGKGSVNATGTLRNIRWLDQICEFVTHDSNGVQLSWLNNVFTPDLSDDFVNDIQTAAKTCNDARSLLGWLNEKKILNKDGELGDWFWVEDKGEGGAEKG